MAYVKTYKVVPTRDAFEVTQGGTETVVARCASRVRAERVKDELNGCDVLPEVMAKG